LSRPFKPNIELILRQCYNIAYGQFTVEEIDSGEAYRIIERYSL
jgi:hypothetical protein